MPSTYTTNLGIEKIATGEQSGTWGTTTNVNWDIADEAINGIVSVTLGAAGSSGSPNALDITNGASSNGRNRFIEFVDGGDLGATAYVQLTPNDAEKIVHIRNSLSGSRALIIFQGTYNASNDYQIENGADVYLKFDGAGTSATVTQVNDNMVITGMTSPLNTDLTITPNGTGDLILDGLKWPQADGTADYVLKTNGSGQLSWTQQSAGSLTAVVDDTAPSLGGDLDINGKSIISTSNGNIPIAPNGTGSVILDGLSWPQADGTADYVLKTNGAGQLSWTENTGSGLSNVVEDSAPQLGGNLDVVTYSIVSTTNRDITITPDGTGDVVLDGLKWPQADGNSSQVLQTNGSGQLSWVDNAGAGGTTLGSLTDVTINTVGDNDLLAYDNATGEWINQTPAEANVATAGHLHAGVYEPADATILKEADVDDTPVNGATTAPASSNWAFDHAADTSAHGGPYESADPTLLRQADVDDTPVNGAVSVPPSSNWAYDHENDSTAHGGPYNNYTHPNHTGQVTSTGDGITALSNTAITAQTALTGGLASTDELLVSDAGSIKRMDITVIEDYMQSNLDFSSGSHTHSGLVVFDSVQTTNFTAAAGKRYAVSTSGAARTMTLPTGTAGDTVAWVDYDQNFATNNLTITSGQDIMNSAADLVININNYNGALMYVNSTVGWMLV